MSQVFPRFDGDLYAGEHMVSELASEFGTPLYVYDAKVIESTYRQFTAEFEGIDLLMAYSVKANSNLDILRRLFNLGSGADIVSLGELHRCLKAGVQPERVVFAGVGKTELEMEAALEAGILAFNVESESELRLLNDVAHRMGKRAPVSIRVNPDILIDTGHEYTRTGHSESKFGIPSDRAVDVYLWAAEQPGLEIVGIDVHIGSQILESDLYKRAFNEVLKIANELDRKGINLNFIDLGGGYGIGYSDEDGIAMSTFANAIVPIVKESGLKLILEPGRFIVGRAGVLITKVLYVKGEGSKKFVVTDSGMNDLIRPSLYGGFHRIEPVQLKDTNASTLVDVVGPICESGDFLARDREMPLPEEGGLLAVHTVGAYGFTMASNYNSRPRAAEIVVDGSEVVLARRRETVDDLIRGELLPNGTLSS